MSNNSGNDIHLVSLTGLPSSGKSSIARILKERARYVHLSNDKVRGELFGPDVTPFDLTESDWVMLFDMLNVYKNQFLLMGDNTVTDNCPHYDLLRQYVLQVSPPLLGFLDKKGYQLKRALVQLDVDMDKLLG